MRRLLCSALSLGAVLWLVAGCRGAVSPSLPAALRLSSADPIWQHLQVRRTAYTNLKGLAQFQMHTAQGGGSLDDVAVVLQHFEAIRMEGFGPFGQAVFLLVSDGQRFSFYLPHERRVISGPVSTQQFVRLFGLLVAPRTLPYLLVGDVPLQTFPDAGRFRYLEADGLYLWEGEAPQEPWWYRVWFDPYRLLPVRFDLATPAHEIVLQVTYEDFRRIDGVTLPYRITLVQPGVDRRVIWHYREVRINTDVAPALFHLRLPPGTERLELD
jgi:hypothetical protein